MSVLGSKEFFARISKILYFIPLQNLDSASVQAAAENHKGLINPVYVNLPLPVTKID